MNTPTLIESAKQLAQRAHHGQLRKDGAPYSVHPERVATMLADKGFDAVTVAAGWLHDTLEDTDVSEEEIAALHPDLLEIVKSVTENSSLPWVVRKKQFTDTLRGGSDRAKAVACADRIDNLTDFLCEYKKVGAVLWQRWPERTPGEKIEADHYFCAMLKSSWQHPLLDQLEELIAQEAIKNQSLK